MPLLKAKHPFRFSTHVDLTELTGLKARTLDELLEHIRNLPGSVIYHHTHRFLKQHQYLSPEPPNDFAIWVAEALQEPVLAERLAAIDTIRFASIRALREKIVDVLANRLARKKPVQQAPEGMEFHFMKSVSFVFPTPHQAADLREFVEGLRRISIHSIYHHVFEARLRLDRGVNDFSRWLEDELGEMVLAVEIARLDPYTHALEDLRDRLVRMTEKRIREIESAGAHHA